MHFEIEVANCVFLLVYVLLSVRTDVPLRGALWSSVCV